MNTTTSVDAQGQEISETHELTSKAREFLERADVIVAGAEARRWIIDLVVHRKNFIGTRRVDAGKFSRYIAGYSAKIEEDRKTGLE